MTGERDTGLAFAMARPVASDYHDGSSASTELTAIVASTDDAIIGKSPSGIITSWNAGAERLYGFTAEEAIGRHLSLCVPPERLAETRDALDRALRGEHLAHYETVRVRKDGQAIEVSVSVSPVRGDGGAVVGASSISRDITVRKRAERRLQAEHAVARLAAEATSFEEVATRLAEALRDSLGVAVAELFVPGPQGGLELLGTAAADAAFAGCTARPLSLSPGPSWPERACRLGRAAWFASAFAADEHRPPEEATRLDLHSGLAFPILRGDDCLAVIALYSRDAVRPSPELLATVAAIGQTIGQLIRRGHAEGELRRDVARRDRFVAMLSHELRNPLAAARAAVTALQREYLDRRARHAAYDVIARQVKHMSDLLDGLLNVARVTQDRLELQVEPLDLAVAIAGAVEMIAPFARERQVTVDVYPLPDPATVVADRARLTQLFANLLTNAVKYSPPGSVVRLVAMPDGSDVVVSVVDHGIGMTRDVIEHAFELFYQADETLDRTQSGMGVGLTLARTIALLHGGNLTATSAGPGEGSTFEVRLPYLQARPQPAPIEPPATGRAFRIVLVEDHEDSREMIRLLLGSEGHTVDAAANGADGLSLIERVKPDVALVDIGLPGIDGFAVAERVRRTPALDRVALIALSGYAQPRDVERARASGFDAHVAKPMTPENLLDIVASVVEEKARGG
jgi:PAS domain S-box-containing protein